MEEIAKIAVYGSDNSISKQKNRSIINDLLKMTLSRKFNLRIYNHNINECVRRRVDINIFMGEINPSFLHLSKINIFFCDLPKFNKKWKPYLKHMDNIICRNNYSYKVMCELVPKNSVFLWNWYSDDIRQVTKKKTSDSILLVANHLDFHNVQTVLDIWDTSWPQLIVYYDSRKIKFKTEKENILLINEAITKTEYRTMINYYKKQIYFTSESEWNYLLYEAYSCEANVLCIKNEMNNFMIFNDKLCIDKFKNQKYKNRYGVKCILDKNSLIEKIENFISLSIEDSNQIGRNNRQLFLQKKKESRKKFEGFFTKMADISEDYDKLSIPDKMEDTELLSLSKLPKVSIVILYNGDSELVNGIISYNINNTTYPKDRLQIVIGSHTDIDLKLDIKYKLVKYNNEKIKLGEMYNKCVEQCKNDYIVFMHDDCVYYPMSIYNRIYSLSYKNIQCSFSTNKHYYDVCEKKHYFTTEPLSRDYFNRCHPFSLSFKKYFWKNNNFVNEWNTYNEVMFVKDKYDKCVEINSLYVGISIIHQNNKFVKNLKIYNQNDSKLDINSLKYLDDMKFKINETTGQYERDTQNNTEGDSGDKTEENVTDNNSKSIKKEINKEFYNKFSNDTKYTEKLEIVDDYVDYSNITDEELLQD